MDEQTELDEETRILIVKAKLDPMSTMGESYKWCQEWHPTKQYWCSRPKGHEGPHLAQFGIGDKNPGTICPCDPNPWE